MRKKILPKLLIAVVVILLAADLFISNYLVNYAIGRSGDGGDREVSLDVETPGEGVEKTIAGPTGHYSRQKRGIFSGASREKRWGSHRMTDWH